MHFTRAENKADEPGYHLKVVIEHRYLLTIWILCVQRSLSPPEIGTLIRKSVTNYCPAGGGPTGPNVVRPFVTPVQNRCPPSPDLCSTTYLVILPPTKKSDFYWTPRGLFNFASLELVKKLNMI